MKWYTEKLGFDCNDYGTNFEWRKYADSSKAFTLWAPFSDSTKYFKPSEKDFMINFRVENLDLLLADLKSQGVKVFDKIEEVEYGRFAWCMDDDGNKIELWEPNDDEYDKISNEGRTH
jgi:predicted enzyme related to lactoylglutathione lyase